MAWRSLVVFGLAYRTVSVFVRVCCIFCACVCAVCVCAGTRARVMVLFDVIDGFVVVGVTVSLLLP